MREPRRTWRRILRGLDVAPGRDAEEQFIAAHFPGVSVSTFRIDLSRGFSASLSEQIESLCASAALPFIRSDWIRPSLRKSFGNPDLIRYVGKRVTSAESFYESLEHFYRRADTYECIRVGGLYSRNRESLISNDGVLEPNPESRRLPYVRLFWERAEKGALTGSSVHVVRTVDRLVELWACAELLRDRGRHDSNSLYLAPITADVASSETPLMGVRVLGDRWTLMSLPPSKPEESRYSSWIESEPLADLQRNYVRAARLWSYEIASQHGDTLTQLMFKMFKVLKVIQKRSSHHSPIEDFSMAKSFKAQMVALAKKGDWYPVVA